MDSFWQLHALSYNETNDAVALPKIPKRKKLKGIESNLYVKVCFTQIVKLSLTILTLVKVKVALTVTVSVAMWHYNRRDKISH